MTTNYTYYVQTPVRAELEKICDLTERSKAYITTKAIEEYVERNSWKVEALKRAKQQADKGEFIVSHDAMGAWINSLGTENEISAPEIDTFKSPV